MVFLYEETALPQILSPQEEDLQAGSVRLPVAVS
jgi:hypothetical protein